MHACYSVINLLRGTWIGVGLVGWCWHICKQNMTLKVHELTSTSGRSWFWYCCWWEMAKIAVIIRTAIRICSLTELITVTESIIERQIAIVISPRTASSPWTPLAYHGWRKSHQQNGGQVMTYPTHYDKYSNLLGFKTRYSVDMEVKD